MTHKSNLKQCYYIIFVILIICKIKPDEYTENNNNNHSKCQLFRIINKVLV